MPFQIIRNDITKVKADAIVNTANPEPVIGSGTDSAIYKAAGARKLLAERKKLGSIAPGAAAYTRAFRLNAKYIIHTVGPAWNGGDHGERDILRACYKNSLAAAAELECESIAFPLIATGVYGFPKDEALRIALDEINIFLLSHDMNVILAVLDRDSFELSARLSGDIRAYIDNHSAAAICAAEYGGAAHAPAAQFHDAIKAERNAFYGRVRRPERNDVFLKASKRAEEPEPVLECAAMAEEALDTSIADAVSGKALAGLGFLGSGEIEIILAVLVVAVRSPHAVPGSIYPRNVVLVDDDAMVHPVDEIVGGIDMVVGHAEPVLAGIIRRSRDVVGGIDIDASFENVG